MTRAEEFSIKYADNKLAIVDKELSETNYHRHTKMGVHIFDGSDIEQAAMDGYEQAEKDLALTWEDVKKIEDLCMEVATLFASIGRNKVILEPPFYEEVARRFNEQRKK